MEDEYWNCPHCGEELKPGAKFCPNCGSDENTGWSEDTYLDGADWRHDEWEPEEEISGPHMTLWGVVLIIVVIVAVVLSALL